MLLNDWLRWVFHAVMTARLRSLLTALGISIGIASVTLLTSIGEGIRVYLMDGFSQFGTRIIAITPGKTTTHGLAGLLTTIRPLSLEDAIKYPVLGAGPGRYACDNTIALPAHPHSFLFRILGEWGIFAFLFMLIFMITTGLALIKILKSRSKVNQTGPPLRAILATSLIAGIIHAGLSGLFIMPASQVAMILIAGWTVSLCEIRPAKSSSSIFVNYLLIAGMLLAVLTLNFATREIPRMSERVLNVESTLRMMPRFWQYGRVCDYQPD